MPIINRVGGGAGSAAFEFEVVNGTTQPSSPAANTIWINTDTPISAWAFQAEQPTGAEGLLWIQTAAASVVAFDAVEENNAIMIYPAGAKLYTNGAWTAVEAFIYQSGAWVQFASLFGIDSLSITGEEGTDYIKIDDGDGNWRVKILTSQTLTASDPGEIDVFLVGGGGGGDCDYSSSGWGGGGGGGYTTTGLSVEIEAETEYTVTIGAGGTGGLSGQAKQGGTSSAFGIEAAGGSPAVKRIGGNGGSGGGAGKTDAKAGGSGGSDGSDGGADADNYGAGKGQNTTTRAFGEEGAELFAGGGGGSGNSQGDGGGADNTGGGGNGNSKKSSSGYNGYSGIVIIRNARG